MDAPLLIKNNCVTLPDSQTNSFTIMFDNSERAFIAINDEAEVCLRPKMANRHGLITEATGTGTTQQISNQLGRTLTRSLLGELFGKK